MRILQATLFDKTKTFCIYEFFRGLVHLDPRPDEVLFVVDKGDLAVLRLLTAMMREYAPRQRYNIEGIIPQKDHLSNIGVGRNVAVKYARTVKPDFLWFVDADIFPAPYAISRLVDANRGGISGGLVATRELPVADGYGPARPSRFNTYRRVVHQEEDGTEHVSFVPVTKFHPGDIFQVTTTGNDCMMIHKDLYMQQLYRWRVEPPRVGEDFAYCLDAWEKGLSVLIDTAVWTDHFSPVEVFSTRTGKLVREWRHPRGEGNAQ